MTKAARDRPLTDFVGSLSDDDAAVTRETLAMADAAVDGKSAATVERALGPETWAGDASEN